MREASTFQEKEKSEKEPPPKRGVSRREFMKAAGGAGLLAALMNGKVEAAVSLLEKATGVDKEKGRGPEISFEIFYSAHKTAKDVEGFDEKVRDADIVIPEAFGWNPWQLIFYRAVADGARSPEEMIRYAKEKKGIDISKTADVAIPKALYESKKFITFIDIPSHHSLVKKIDAAKLEQPLDLRQDLDMLLKKVKNMVESYADLQKERENYMLSELAEFVEKLRDNPSQFPELAKKGKIKILLFLGSDHTRIYHGLKSTPEDASRWFKEKPYIFGSYVNEAIRRHLMGKEIDDSAAVRLLFHGMIEPLLFKKLEKVTDDSVKILVFLRHLVDVFSIEEIKGIFDESRNTGLPGVSFRQIFHHKLYEKGVVIPRSTLEFEEVFNKLATKGHSK